MDHGAGCVCDQRSGPPRVQKSRHAPVSCNPALTPHFLHLYMHILQSKAEGTTRRLSAFEVMSLNTTSVLRQRTKKPLFIATGLAACRLFLCVVILHSGDAIPLLSYGHFTFTRADNSSISQPIYSIWISIISWTSSPSHKQLFLHLSLYNLLLGDSKPSFDLWNWKQHSQAGNSKEGLQIVHIREGELSRGFPVQLTELCIF